MFSDSGNVRFVNKCNKVLRLLSWWPGQKACRIRIDGLIAGLLSTSETTEWPPPECSSRLSLWPWPFIDWEAAEEYPQYQQYCQKCDKNPLDNLPPNAWFRTCKMDRGTKPLFLHSKSTSLSSTVTSSHVELLQPLSPQSSKLASLVILLCYCCFPYSFKKNRAYKMPLPFLIIYWAPLRVLCFTICDDTTNIIGVQIQHEPHDRVTNSRDRTCWNTIHKV
jgi:hypothetical protein